MTRPMTHPSQESEPRKAPTNRQRALLDGLAGGSASRREAQADTALEGRHPAAQP
jgi:hypothetical protein